MASENQKSDTPLFLEKCVTKLLLALGYHHKRIAALHDWNQGRVAEIAADDTIGWSEMFIVKRL